MRHCNNPGGLEVERLFLCHTTKLYKLAASLYHVELSITVTHFLLQEDLKHITKQYKWVISKSRLELLLKEERWWHATLLASQ